MKNISRKSLIKFSIAAIAYILWVIWMENYWLFLGLLVILDIYITKKVKWGFWKKYDGPKRKMFEWIDALVFAAIAASMIKIFIFELYAIPTGSLEKSLRIGDRIVVSKVAYGPRLPNTPVYFPFVHNTLPMTKSVSSYIEAIKLPYKRLAGLTEIQRFDYVTFNFPAGDTVVVGNENPDYYTWIRWRGRKAIEANFDIKARPVDRRENYVKRCVGLPGDSLQVINGEVYVNGIKEPNFKGVQFEYLIKTKGQPLTEYLFDKYDIPHQDIQQSGNAYVIPLTRSQYKEMSQMPNIASISRYSPQGAHSPLDYFPNDSLYLWSKDNYGPIYLPKAGDVVQLTKKSIPLFRRIITAYELNTLEEKEDGFYINGEKETEYTIKMDYYFMMGDNRDNSQDSRSWGYVPVDHIVGKPVMVFFSTNKDKSFISSIRWNRIFKWIDPMETM